MKLSDITALVIDHGLYIHVAQKLAESYGRVMYFSPWTESGFPSSKRRQIGTGIENVERVFDLWDAVGEADLVVSCDVYYHDLVEYLRAAGKPVWGAGRAEALEVERAATKRLMQSLDLDWTKNVFDEIHKIIEQGRTAGVDWED